MLLAAILALASSALAPGCTRDNKAQSNDVMAPPDKTGDQTGDQADDPPGDPPGDTPTGKPTEKPMAIDTSPAAWDAARAVAAQETGKSPDELRKKNDELPFVFAARGMHPVLVLDGQVVTETGAQVAADYLRRLGLASGQEISLNSVLYVLFTLRAFPEVDDLPPQSYVFAESARMKDLTARVETGPDRARVVLHYLLPKATEDGDSVGPEVRDVVRTTLEIADSGGTVEWRRENIQWTAPE